MHHFIVISLKGLSIVFIHIRCESKSNLYGTRDASICVKGPGYVSAHNIILPPSVEIVDNIQHIAKLIEPINL